MMAKPGYGFSDLHLREHKDALCARFGAPATKRRSGAFREYWLYPGLHFDCIVSRRSGEVLSIFVERGTPFLDNDVFAADETRIRAQFGEPDLEGGDFTLSTGHYVGKWLSYPQGIGFHFNANGKLETLGIFSPSRRKLANRKAQVRAPLALAALRR
ncbi:MAG TPA: hypothetical protein VIJ79_12880 [Acidobacteriaceae bacterium]